MTRVVSVSPPMRGVYRRSSLQGQPEGTMPDALDVLPIGYQTGRELLAVRPGWATFGSANSTNLIASLNVAPDEAYKRLMITASGGTLYRWAATSKSSIGSGISTGRNVQAAPYLGKLYIANNSSQGVKVYDYATDGLSAWTATSGTVPEDCRLICEWRNRIVLAAPPSQPHLWYMSRIDDPLDWLFAEDDAASPVASSDIIGGQISEPITALIPHNRDCLIIGTANTIRVWRGDPVDGGYLETVSHVTGPVDGTAWCKTSDDWTYMLTRDGLYRMPPGCGENPQPVSRALIPNSLLGVDGITNIAYMAYDVRFRGIHIYVTGESSEYWWFDVEHEGFWPFTVPGSSILAIGRIDQIETDDVSGVLVGTSTGLKRLDRTAAIGGASAAYAQILIKLENVLGIKSGIKRAVVKFTEDTTDLGATVSLYAAETIEDVLNLPAGRRFTVTVRDLNNNHLNCNPRIGGQSGLMVITQDKTSKTWVFEEAALYLDRKGKER